MEVADAFSFLIGRWSLNRLIIDYRACDRGSYQGFASLTETKLPLGNEYGRSGDYLEEGEFHFGTHKGQSQRRLIYCNHMDMEINLFFPDGRFFTNLDLRTGSWRTIHECGADYYEITTTVLSDDEVHEHWRVTGPSKDFSATTTLLRLRS